MAWSNCVCMSVIKFCTIFLIKLCVHPSPAFFLQCYLEHCLHVPSSFLIQWDCFFYLITWFFWFYSSFVLSSQDAEKHLSEMVVSKALVAKIDRPVGIVCFQPGKDSNDILNSWAFNLEKLLDLVEKSCHQIHKETMVHKAATIRAWNSEGLYM